MLGTKNSDANDAALSPLILVGHTKPFLRSVLAESYTANGIQSVMSCLGEVN